MDVLYFNVSLLEVDVEADQDEADVDEKRKQATDDKEHLGANWFGADNDGDMEDNDTGSEGNYNDENEIYNRIVSLSVCTFLTKSLKIKSI